MTIGRARKISLVLLTVLLLGASAWSAEITVVDDLGTSVALSKPATRVVSLAPHATELLFAVGAGAQLVGAVEYSDYPESARSVPRVGSAAALDLEAILALRPDLVVAWQTGNPEAQIARLRAFGVPVFVSEPRSFLDIASNLDRLGQLTGNVREAQDASEGLRAEYQRLQTQYAGRAPVRVFYEVWHQPLITVNGQHIISAAIELCGGVNVFADLGGLAPRVEVESVIARNPEVIIASDIGSERPTWLDDWRRWSRIDAVRASNLYFVPPDLLHRHTPRLLQGAREVCLHLEEARAKR